MRYIVILLLAIPMYLLGQDIEKIYDINYLTGFDFIYNSKDTTKTSVRLAVHSVIYKEDQKGNAILYGIESIPWQDIDLTTHRKDTLRVYFSEPFYDPNKKLKIEYSVYDCE